MNNINALINFIVILRLFRPRPLRTYLSVFLLCILHTTLRSRKFRVTSSYTAKNKNIMEYSIKPTIELSDKIERQIRLPRYLAFTSVVKLKFSLCLMKYVSMKKMGEGYGSTHSYSRLLDGGEWYSLDIRLGGTRSKREKSLPPPRIELRPSTL